MNYEPPGHELMPLDAYEDMQPHDANVVDFAIGVPVPLNNPPGILLRSDNPMTNLDHALGYAVKGKPVFPCRPDKTPMTSHGFKDASTDPEKIKNWWTANPDALIGMPTGAISELVIIDVDNKNGHDGDDALFQLQQKRGKLPAAPEVLTPSGGRHIYFRHPGTPIKSTASTIGDGLDIRGDGGYVIVPPSKIGSTGYEWEASNPEGIPPMPGWLIELTKKSPRRESAGKATGGASVGSRNNHLTSQAGRMRYAGLEQDAILARLLVENEKLDPPLGSDEVEKIATSVAGYEAGDEPATEWPEITPLPERGDTGFAKPYPLGDLPDEIRKSAAEVARFAMVPEASPGIIGLSVLAAAIGKKAVIVERPGLEHYPAIFFALIASSGERKSPPFKLMTRPFEEWAESQKPDYERLAREVKAMNTAVDASISGIKSAAKKAGNDLEGIAGQIAEIEKRRMQAPSYPSMFTTDTTEQRLFQKMHDREGAYAVMSGEGRPVFDAIMGKYSGEGRTGDAIYLAGISGDTITRDRVGGENGPEERVITRPCLNVCVMVQPGKYLETANVQALRDSGALARVWPVWLSPKAGMRLEREGEKGLDFVILKPFYEKIRAVMNHESEKTEHGRTIPHKARLSPEATKARREFHNYVESLMAEGQDLEDVCDIASKAVSQTCKLALILHIAENHKVLNDPESEIELDTWAVAQSLGTYHLTEAVRVQRMAGESKAMEEARRVLLWIGRNELHEISTARLTQSGPRPRVKAAQAREVLEILEEHGYLRARRVPGKRKPVFDVNPAYLATLAGLAGGRGQK